MTRAEARDRARGHAARCLHTHLDAGWPDPAEFGYTEAEAALVAQELERIADRLNGGPR